MHETEKHYVHELNGLGRKMPIVFLVMLVSSFALMGVPGFAGFISKWNLIAAAAETSNPFAWAGVLVLLISAVLTAMYLFSVVIKAYFPGPGFSIEQIETVRDPRGGYMKVPMIILCITILVLGVCSTPFVSYLEQIGAGIM